MKNIKIYIGTSNPGKLKEYLELTKSSLFEGYEFLPAPTMDVDEPYDTFAKNSAYKATTYSKALNALVISEDCGLCICGLPWFPGVYSARVGELLLGKAGVAKIMELFNFINPSQLNRELIKNIMSLSTEEDTTAHYEAHISLADKRGVVIRTFVGEWWGEIVSEARGENGFGYDGIFCPNNRFEKTVAEMSLEEKNKISHRAIACEALGRCLNSNKEYIRSLI